MPPKVKSAAELLRGIASGLKIAAVRPSIHGYIPHEKQLLFHQSVAQARLFAGGNRSGKTVAGATESIWYLTGKHPYKKTPEPPVWGRCVTVDFLNGMEKIVKPEIARWMPPSELINGSWSDSWDSDLKTLTLANGSFLEFMSQDQDLDKFAGSSRHFNWFDEECPHDIFVECKARLIDTGGDYWFTITPVEGMTWIYDEIYLAAATNSNIDVVEVDTLQNPHINKIEVEQFITGLTKDEIDARLHGKFVQIGGLIYKMFGEQNIIDSFIPDQKDFLIFAGMDHGLNNPTAWLWGAVDKDGRIIIWDEHYEPGQIVRYHAQKVHEKNQEHGFVPEYYVGDPSIRNRDPITGTSVHLEYQENGISIILGNNDVPAGIDRVARYLTGIQDEEGNYHPKLFFTRNCVNTIYEHQRYRRSLWASKKDQFNKNKKETPHKKDDHTCDTVRYMIASRPEFDDGKDIPRAGNFLGVATAVGLERVVDKDLFGLNTSRPFVDPHLGEEF